MPRAPRRCARPGCDALAPCQEHKPRAWASSSRRLELPSDWSGIRRTILTRDPVCQLAYPGEWMTARGPARCAGRSVEVDHIGDKRDHSSANLRGVCSACHRRRTGEQSRQGRQGRRQTAADELTDPP